MKRKERLRVVEGKDSATLKARLYVKESDCHDLREKAQDLYQHSTTGSYVQKSGGLLQRVRGVIPSWFQSTAGDYKKFESNGKSLTLDTVEGRLESYLIDEHEGRVMLGMNAVGKPSFVNNLYEFIRKTQK